MHIRRVELVNFRSYERVELDLEPGASVLIGPNGIGKTNLVEALGYVATLSSHRVATDAPLVRTGASSAIIRCHVMHNERELLVELEIVPGKANRARLGRSAVRRARDVAGALKLVMFAPEDIELVRGDPAGRRRFLDELLVARQPRFAAVCADYDKVLKQRNALLRTAVLARRAGGSTDLSTLDVWDSHLAARGAELVAGRRDLVTALAGHVSQAYAALAGIGSHAALTYRCGLPGELPDDVAGISQALVAALAQARVSETERGSTLIGPHRDDLELTFAHDRATEAMPVKGYASHGEAWSYAVALRLAAYRLLRTEGVEPVLVLDDVFAELDTGRRERLAHSISDAAQTLVTCAVEQDVPATLRGARYEVSEGKITSA